MQSCKKISSNSAAHKGGDPVAETDEPEKWLFQLTPPIRAVTAVIYQIPPLKINFNSRHP